MTGVQDNCAATICYRCSWLAQFQCQVAFQDVVSYVRSTLPEVLTSEANLLEFRPVMRALLLRRRDERSPLPG